MIETDRVADVFSKVDRAEFCQIYEKEPYDNKPKPIGCGVNISAPHMHAYCLEWLEKVLKPGARCLDVGSGGGAMLAMFYEMTKQTDGKANIFGIEHMKELADFGNENLKKSYK